MRRREVTAALVVVMLCGCQSSPATRVDRAERLPPPSSDGLLVKHPHAAVTPAGQVVVVWGLVASDGTADVAFAIAEESTVGELRPVRVNPVPGSAVAGRQVGPRVAVTGEGRIIVSWVDREFDLAGDIVTAFSDDGGKSFSQPLRVNDDDGAAGQEYHDLAVLPDGTIAVIWLDERDAPAGQPNQKELYLAVSRDDGRTFERNRRLTSSTTGVCPCCRPGMTAGADSLRVIYRDRVGENLHVRVLSLSFDGVVLALPEDVPSSPWSYQACPIDGPSIAAGPDGELVVAWMDGASGVERVLFAGAEDAVQPLVQRGHLRASAGDSVARRPALTASEGVGVVAAWEDTAGRVWFRGLDEPSSVPILLSDGGEAGEAHSVVLVATSRAVHAFWCEESLSAAAWTGEDPAIPSARLGHARAVKGEEGWVIETGL